MLSVVASPARANGTTWWSSRKPRSAHRPAAPTNAHLAPSRLHTSLLTAAGIWREPGLGSFARWGRLVAASLFSPDRQGVHLTRAQTRRQGRRLGSHSETNNGHGPASRTLRLRPVTGS